MSRSGSACPRRRTRSRRSAASWSARGAPARSSTPACASRWTCRSTSRSSRWSSRSKPRPGADPLDPMEHVAGGEATRRSIWPAIYPEILRLVKAHRSTIVFVNARRGAERLALRLNELANADLPDGAAARRHRPRPPRLARARGAHGRRGDAQGRRAALPRRHLVAGARHRHGRGRPRPAGRVAEVRRPRPAADRPRRPQRRRRLQGPHLPEVPRRPARVRGRLQAHARRADRADRRAAQRARRARPAHRLDRGQRARG